MLFALPPGMVPDGRSKLFINGALLGSEMNATAEAVEVGLKRKVANPNY
jgi:hypothetical protein